MTRKKVRNINLNRKRARLIKEAKQTGKAALGLTPLSKVMTIHDIATGTPRLVKAARVYGNELYSETKRRIGRRNPFN